MLQMPNVFNETVILIDDFFSVKRMRNSWSGEPEFAFPYPAQLFCPFFKFLLRLVKRLPVNNRRVIRIPEVMPGKW